MRLSVSESARTTIERGSPPMVLCLGLAVACLAVWAVGSPNLARIATGAMINVVLVVGVYIFVGNSGILSFGHMAFAGVGGYMTAWLTLRPQMKAMMLPGLPEFVQQAQLPTFVAALAAGASAVLLAVTSGAFIMRLNGIAAAIATLALLAIFYTVYSNFDSLTGGVGSLVGIPTGLQLWGVFAWACFAIMLAHLHADSASGLALRAVREDEVAATAAGLRGHRLRLLAFGVSAFVVGVGGYLQARFLGVVSPDSFYFNATFVILTMLIVGGMNSLTGAVAGVFAVTAVNEFLIRLEGSHAVFGTTWTIPAGLANCVLALTLCLVLIKRPSGLLGHCEVRISRRQPNEMKNPTKKGNMS